MKVLIAGAGAIGQWLGARLAAAGHDVTLLARPKHVDAVQARLVISGKSTFDGPLNAVATVSQAGSDYGAIVVTSKAHQTVAVGKSIAPLLAANGTLLSLQNGLGNAQKLQHFVPAAQIAVGLTSHGVTVTSPGRLVHAGTGPTLVGPAISEGASAAHQAHELFSDAGLDPEPHNDMRPFIWRKAIVNAGINPLGALHGLPNGELAARVDHLDAARALVAEGEAVATRAGVHLPPGDLAQALEQTLRLTAENRCSMLQDVEAHRPTEIEQITGRMVRLAKRLSLPMPRSNVVYAHIKELEMSYLGRATTARMTREELEWEKQPF